MTHIRVITRIFFFFKFSNFVEIGEIREDFWIVLGGVFPFWGTIRGEQGRFKI